MLSAPKPGSTFALGGANLEVQHVAFGVVVGVVEDQWTDLDA
jgi:hypothetical protein